MKTKICTKCNREFLATTEFFHRKKNGKYGLQSECKNCVREYHRQYYQNHKEEQREYHKQYYQKNKKYHKEHAKKNKQFWKTHNPYNENETKTCSRCKKEQPKTKEFWYRNIRKLDGLTSHCKKCYLKDKSDYYKNNKEIVLNRIYKSNYGISFKEYRNLLEKQNYKCAICGADIKKNYKYALDHNHKTGEIREFLCHTCNLIIGALHENIFILIKMIKYLKKHNYES